MSHFKILLFEILTLTPLKRSEMACRVTFNCSAIICCVCVSSSSNNACSSWSSNFFGRFSRSLSIILKSRLLKRWNQRSQFLPVGARSPSGSTRIRWLSDAFFFWSNKKIMACRKWSLFGSKFDMFNTKKKYASYSEPTKLTWRFEASCLNNKIALWVRRIL